MWLFHRLSRKFFFSPFLWLFPSDFQNHLKKFCSSLRNFFSLSPILHPYSLSKSPRKHLQLKWFPPFLACNTGVWCFLALLPNHFLWQISLKFSSTFPAISYGNVWWGFLLLLVMFTSEYFCHFCNLHWDFAYFFVRCVTYLKGFWSTVFTAEFKWDFPSGGFSRIRGILLGI